MSLQKNRRCCSNKDISAVSRLRTIFADLPTLSAPGIPPRQNFVTTEHPPAQQSRRLRSSTDAQDESRNVLFLFATGIPVKGYHLRPQRCPRVQVLQEQMPQKRTSPLLQISIATNIDTDSSSQFKMKRNPRKLAWTKR